MKGVLKFILFLEIVLLCSCVNDEKRSGAFGGMSLHLSANSSVTDVTTRSSEEVLPSIQDFPISVLQGDKVQASWDKLSDYDEDTTFPVGSYTLKAFYGDIEKEGFDSPYYEGTTDFNIRGGENTRMISNSILRLILLPYRQSWEVKFLFRPEKHVLLM